MRDHREEIIAVTHALDDAGMVPNKSGNVSCRVAGGFAILFVLGHAGRGIWRRKRSPSRP